MNVQIYEEASDWVVKHRSGALDVSEKHAFDRWLRESPQHVSAYLEMSALWENLPALDRSWNPAAEELISRARTDANVVPLTSRSSVDSRVSANRETPAMQPAVSTQLVAHDRDRQSPARRRRGLGVLGALAASVLIFIASGTWWYLERGVYRTDIGEQRWLTLADGSVVELNARSRIRVDYRDDERHVDLLQGQALFHVAKNKQRPFVVASGDTHVRAVGTSFDVYRASSGTVVTVVEGRVAVRTGQPQVTAGAGDVLIAAGEQVVVTNTALVQPKQANVVAATAWARRSLVFDTSPLTLVAEEFNRYNVRPLIIEDAALASFRISGVFSSVDPTLLIKFLQAQPELVVEETETQIRVRKR